MDAMTTPEVRPPEIAEDPRLLARQADQLIDALKRALEEPGEHRLYKWGKLAGLFPSRVGASGAASTQAVRSGLLEITRTEVRGKLIVEWVKVTPAAVLYVAEHDSPKAVLRELKSVLGNARAALPGWMLAARDEAAQLALRFEHRAQEMLERLDRLGKNVEAALRRAETARPGLSAAMVELVPWGVAALEYLDRRLETLPGDCPLPDLFRALEVRCPDLTLAAFQEGVRRLHDVRALQLLPAEIQSVAEPEFAFIVDGDLVWQIRR